MKRNVCRLACYCFDTLQREMGAAFHSGPPDFRSSVAFEGSQAAPVCSYINVGVCMALSVERWWNAAGELRNLYLDCPLRSDSKQLASALQKTT
jgi:hypothetical protein